MKQIALKLTHSDHEKVRQRAKEEGMSLHTYCEAKVMEDIRFEEDVIVRPFRAWAV